MFTAVHSAVFFNKGAHTSEWIMLRSYEVNMSVSAVTLNNIFLYVYIIIPLFYDTFEGKQYHRINDIFNWAKEQRLDIRITFYTLIIRHTCDTIGLCIFVCIILVFVYYTNYMHI